MIASLSALPFARALFALVLFAVVALRARADDLRIGMVGLDTSHVVAYLSLLNDPAAKEHVPGGRVVAAVKGGSADVENSASRVDGYTKIAVEKYGVKIYDTVEEMTQHVDAILILAVDGRPHLDQFRRTLGAKKPVFIDKPMAGSLKDAVEIVRLAKATGTPVFSSSSLRYTPDSPLHQLPKGARITAAFSFGPAELEPHHPDFYWYGIHSVEALYAVLGAGCVSVTRTHTPDTDVIVGVWSDGRVGTVQGNRAGGHGYGVTVFAPEGSYSGGAKQSYVPLVRAYLKFFQTGLSAVPLETTLEIHAFMEAADESKRRGGTPVTLAEVLKQAGYQP